MAAYPLDIGQTLVAARRARRMRQRELGARVGVAQQQIARWEATGYRAASLDRVDAVARALGLSWVIQAVADPPMGPVRDLGEVAARIRSQGRELEERFGIVRVGVFGAFAAGEQTPTSHVDLLVDMVEPGGRPPVEAADYVEELLGRKTDLVRSDGIGEELRTRVMRDVLWVWSA